MPGARPARRWSRCAQAAAGVFGPLESTASSARQPVDNLRDRFAEMDRLKAENEKLKKDNEDLTRDLNTTDYARNRATELDRLLKLAPAYAMTPARVIGIGSAQSFNHTVTIDAGTADGVRVDMTVLNGDRSGRPGGANHPGDRDRAADRRPQLDRRRPAERDAGARVRLRPRRGGTAPSTTSWST